MKVIRLCEKEEIESIMKNKNFSEAGSHYDGKGKRNNLKAEPDKKYLSFFQDISGIFYIKPTKDKYICTYNIPDLLLELGKGYGEYPNSFNPQNMDIVPEYILPTEILDIEYLEKVDKITKDLNIKDMFFNPYFKNLTENIYDINKDDENSLN